MNPEITNYIEQFEPSIQERMNQVRQLVFALIPEVKEKISWGMPTYYVRESLFHFAGQKHHLGIYPGPEAIEYIKPKLGNYKFSKGAIQFPYGQELPLALIQEIIEYIVSNMA